MIIIYWFSGRGPCLPPQDIPSSRELAQKMKGRPFTLLGVVTDGWADVRQKSVNSYGCRKNDLTEHFEGWRGRSPSGITIRSNPHPIL